MFFVKYSTWWSLLSLLGVKNKSLINKIWHWFSARSPAWHIQLFFHLQIKNWGNLVLCVTTWCSHLKFDNSLSPNQFWNLFWMCGQMSVYIPAYTCKIFLYVYIYIDCRCLPAFIKIEWWLRPFNMMPVVDLNNES